MANNKARHAVVEIGDHEMARMMCLRIGEKLILASPGTTASPWTSTRAAALYAEVRPGSRA